MERSPLEKLLLDSETAYIEAQNLLPLLKDYTNPRDLISRLVKSGQLIRLKNGFFVIAEKISKNPVPFAQIANLLYGPSYLSYEWALAYYGFIPEGVPVATSASALKSKSFTTPLGSFDYQALSHLRYSIGFDQQENEAGKFLIATPEKALADLVHLKSAGLTEEDLWMDLTEARRIEPEAIKSLNRSRLKEIAEVYKSKSVTTLARIAQ